MRRVKGHVVPRRQVVEEAEILEHNANAAAQAGQHPTPGPGDVAIKDADDAPGRPVRQVHQPQ